MQVLFDRQISLQRDGQPMGSELDARKCVRCSRWRAFIENDYRAARFSFDHEIPKTWTFRRRRNWFLQEKKGNETKEQNRSAGQPNPQGNLVPSTTDAASTDTGDGLSVRNIWQSLFVLGRLSRWAGTRFSKRDADLERRQFRGFRRGSCNRRTI